MRHGAIWLANRLTATRCRYPRRFGYPAQQRCAASARTWSTPLAKTIADAIEVRNSPTQTCSHPSIRPWLIPLGYLQTTGPMSIAAYMRQCLTSPQGGYYASSRGLGDAERPDQFGTKGDFITSPEISQVFGEIVGICSLNGGGGVSVCWVATSTKEP